MARTSRWRAEGPSSTHATEFSAGAIGPIGAIGAVTKTPSNPALQNTANPGVPDPAFAVLKDTSENHIVLIG